MVCGFAAGKKYRVLNLTYEDVQRIQIDPCKERSLFKSVESEQITVVTGKNATPIVYKMLKNRQYWDEYKAGFAKFAKNNTITFVDNTV